MLACCHETRLHSRAGKPAVSADATSVPENSRTRFASLAGSCGVESAAAGSGQVRKWLKILQTTGPAVQESYLDGVTRMLLRQVRIRGLCCEAFCFSLEAKVRRVFPTRDTTASRDRP
jgi:hypothetical protein